MLSVNGTNSFLKLLGEGIHSNGAHLQQFKIKDTINSENFNNTVRSPKAAQVNVLLITCKTPLKLYTTLEEHTWKNTNPFEDLNGAQTEYFCPWHQS